MLDHDTRIEEARLLAEPDNCKFYEGCEHTFEHKDSDLIQKAKEHGVVLVGIQEEHRDIVAISKWDGRIVYKGEHYKVREALSAQDIFIKAII